MNRQVNLSKVLLICIPFYLSQGILIPQGIVPRLLLMLWLLIDLFYVVLYLAGKEKDSLANIILIFWLLNAFSWVISPKLINVSGDVIRTLDHFKNLTIALLTYFPFSYFIKHRLIGDKHLKVFALIMFVLAIIMFFQYDARASLERSSDENTNNEGYLFITLLPLLYLFRNKRFIWYALLVAALFFVLLSAKRGAIICIALQILVFIFYNDTTGNKQKSSTFKKVSVAFILFLIIGFIAFTFIQGNDYLLWRVTNMQAGEDRSGDVRLLNYASILEAFVNGSFINQIFGYGFNQTLLIGDGHYAHNDWLELLADQGLIGVIIYMMLLIRLFKTTKFVHGDGWRKCMIFMVLGPWLVRSVFSMGYVSMETFYFMVAIAYAKYGDIGTYSKINQPYRSLMSHRNG